MFLGHKMRQCCQMLMAPGSPQGSLGSASAKLHPGTSPYRRRGSAGPPRGLPAGHPRCVFSPRRRTAPFAARVGLFLKQLGALVLWRRVSLARITRPSLAHSHETHGVSFHREKTGQQAREGGECVRCAARTQSAVVIKGRKDQPVRFLYLPDGHSSGEIPGDSDHRSQPRRDGSAAVAFEC